MRAWTRLVLGATLLGAGTSSCDSSPAPLSAVLVTLDTTNREALGCYGQPLGLTPNLDRIAAQGLRFDNARTVAPLTLPAHSSMHTGLVPLRHGVRDNALLALPRAAETLAERLVAAGYETAAFVSAVVLAAPYGLDQGFETYDAPRGRQALATAHMLERPAAATVAAASAWLRARDRSRPFFLWVHAFEPHEPYAPPEEFLERAQGDPYLGEVAALDHAVGELLGVLEQEHGLERTVLVVVADHGEALGDHGERTHSVLCYERVLAVPLLVRLPAGERGGTSVARPVSVVDVAPTFLDALGLSVPSGLDGASLLAETGPGGAYFESYTGYLNYGWSPLAGWAEGDVKYLHSSAPELYALASDPGESTNLYGEGVPEVERAHAALRDLAARPRLVADPDLFDEGLAADVQALGYAGAAAGGTELPEPLAPSELPAPRERMHELERFYRAVLRKNKGKTAEAIAELEALVAENPLNATALNVLATALYEQKELARALSALERIPAHARARVTVQDLLGHVLEQLGRTEEALAHFQEAERLKPGDPHQLEDVRRLAGR